MTEVQEIQRKTIERYNAVLKLDGEEFRKGYIVFLRALHQELETNLSQVTINDVPLFQAPAFTSKKDFVTIFWDKVLSITKGKHPVEKYDSQRIPQKLALISTILEKYQKKEELTEEEVYVFLNCYRSLFELIMGILLPHFKQILNKKAKDHLDWSDISTQINELTPQAHSIFDSMNGQLRNAIAHEMYILTDNEFYWIKDTGELDVCPLEKVFDKIIDLICLMSGLYITLSKQHIELQIKVIEKGPIKQIKNAIVGALSNLPDL